MTPNTNDGDVGRSLPLPITQIGDTRRGRGQGNRLVRSAKLVGWDQWRFAATAHREFSTFPNGGPALELSLSHPTMKKAMALGRGNKPWKQVEFTRQMTRGRRGVTLVEVLAATMLSVVLLTAINGILRSMQTQRKALAGDTGAAEWRRSLVDQLTWDALNSRRIHVRANRVRLIGYAGRDPVTGMPQHRPTEVVYHVFVDEGQSWLVREESRLDDRTNRNWTRELVAHDVGSIKLFRVDATGDEHDLEAGAAAQTEPFAIPGHMRFVIATGEGRELVSGRVSRTW